MSARDFKTLMRNANPSNLASSILSDSIESRSSCMDKIVGTDSKLDTNMKNSVIKNLFGER